MNALSLLRINEVAPYIVWQKKEWQLCFKTANNILLVVEFEEDETLSFPGSV